MDIIKVAVRAVVEFILRSGDINYGSSSGRDLLNEGMKAHKKVQKMRHGNYTSELSLRHEFPFPEHDFIISLEGRADGVYIDDSGMIWVEEIKSTLTPLDDFDGKNMLHLGQALCYAYMLSCPVYSGADCGDVNEKLSKIYEKSDKTNDKYGIQLTYFNLENEQMKEFTEVFEAVKLNGFMQELMKKYIIFVIMEREWKKRRNASIKDLPFPFREYRKGQRTLAGAVYRAVTGGYKLFAEAPTGIGKTASVLYPSLKAMVADGEAADKVFYLTAKTITRTVITETLKKMQGGGLALKSIIITAKDKICPLEVRNCNPDACPYAKGHYDRINGALYAALLDTDSFSAETVSACAEKYMVCPYELSLDLALFADLIACDYNYVFDPMVFLRRFFGNANNKNYVFLIDEVHNLPDRAREMYSARLGKSSFTGLKKVLGRKGSKLFRRCITNISNMMMAKKKECTDPENKKGYTSKKEFDSDFAEELGFFMAECELFLKENAITGANEPETVEAVLKVYFEVIRFNIIAQYYDEHYISLASVDGGDLIYRLYCLDPSALIGEALKKAKSAVLFSATMAPVSFYREICGQSENDVTLRLDSPFESENFCLVVCGNINTRYKQREESMPFIAEYIKIMFEAKKGNYIAFFPSYEFMVSVYDNFRAVYPDIAVTMQKMGMSESEREEFLSLFKENGDEALLAFCVLGGVFSEGIDLAGSRLIGVAVIGVGLPRLSAEGDIIKNYFNDKNGRGYEYSYQYPGINKVMQAAGRVIRTSTDRGVVLLLDERFTYKSYRDTYPAHWNHAKIVKNSSQAKSILGKFWEI